MATTAAILEKMRLMISEEGKGPLDPRLRASFCDWCVRRFPPEGLAELRGKPWPTNACPCHLVSYCGANCQASHWAAHSATCEQLRGADAESGEMPVLETGPADLPSIHLAGQVKRLAAEVKLQKEELAVEEHAFHGLMDLLVQSILNLSSRNDALESHSIHLAAQIKRLTTEVKLQKEELAAATRQYAFHGLMNLLVQHTNLATRNDALEFDRNALAVELIQTLSARSHTLWSANERHQIEQSEVSNCCCLVIFSMYGYLVQTLRYLVYVQDHKITDEHWTAFLEESQEMFNEECTEVSLRLWNEWSAAQLP